LCGLDYLHSELYEAAFTGVAEASGATAAFFFDAPAPFTETGFFAGADFFAAFVVEAFFAAFRTFAHRAFWVAAILARAPALKVCFLLLFARNPTFVRRPFPDRDSARATAWHGHVGVPR
jgi:hypothetical protein